MEYISAAEAALAFCGPARELTCPGIYLRLMRAVACYALGHTDEARRRLLAVMRDVLPCGFITPFAELAPFLGGLMEQCLEREFPARYDDVIGQCKRTLPNWIAFHNRFTKDNVTAILSLREYEIAAQFHVSVGRLKTILHEIYGKLLVSNRKELARFIL